MRSVAIIGAGPIGLETALAAREAGLAATVYEAGRVGEHFRRYGAVRLFTPFHMNSTPLGRARLAASGAALPQEEEILTGAAFCERYLGPLSRVPELRDVVREGERVLGLTREGCRKTHGVAVDERGSRAARPFLLKVRSQGGATRFDRADAIVDASGVYATPNATGPGGLPAIGEEALGDRIERHIPAILGPDRDRYAGARILLIGDGRSAATVIRDMGEVASSRAAGAGHRLEWVHRDRGDRMFTPVPAETLRALPELRALHEGATAVAGAASWIRRHPGASVLSYRVGPSGDIEVTIREKEGSERTLSVDRVLALAGYRPDVELCRELQVHLCYASEGPMALSAAILAAQAADPSAAGDCLSQVAHGPASLKSPEPDFYVLGAKSYGRNPNFLLSIGHRQVADALELIAEGAAAGAVLPRP